MSVKLIMVLASLGLLIGYLVYSFIVFGGLTPSVSDTYHYHKERGKGAWLFTAVLAICAATIMPILLGASSEGTEFLAYLACAATIFVAVAPNYNMPLTYEVHFGAAVVACVTAFAWCLSTEYWYLSCIVLGVCLSLCVVKPKCWLLFVELGVLLSLYLTLATILA